MMNLAALSGFEEITAGFAYVAEARTGCDRSIRQLRRRLMQSVAQLCRHLDVHDVGSISA
jgi:hypothetical protein